MHRFRCHDNISWTWNVSEYMLVLALCLVIIQSLHLLSTALIVNNAFHILVFLICYVQNVALSIRALILSRLDYCNSLFACNSQSTLHRLQRVAAARLLCGVSARTHAPPLLKQLHWLPVSSRIHFKLCTLMFDISHGTAPQYLSELVRRCDDTRLRSNVRGNFVVSSHILGFM